LKTSPTRTRRRRHETDKALGFPVTNDDDLCWVPKSQCHAIEFPGYVKLWVRDWLVDKKPGLNYLK